MGLSFSSFGASVIGARTRQEDAFGIFPDVSGWDLFIVSDGMGGHPNGDKASKIAVESFPEAFEKARLEEVRSIEAEAKPFDAFRRRLVHAFRGVSEAVLPSQGGATLSVLLRRLRDDRIVVAWAGDSPILQLRREDGRPAFHAVHSTEDHGLGWMLDKMVGEPALSDRHRRNRDEPAVDDWKVPLDGDLFVLCTDGISSTFPTRPMRDRFAAMGKTGQGWANVSNPSLELVLGRLSENGIPFEEVPVSLANEAVISGSHDNCTAIAVKVRKE